MLPENFKLLGLDIKIIHSERDADHDYYTSDYEKCEISIFTEYALERVKERLFSSLFFFAIHSHLKLNLDDDSYVNLERMIWAVFRDNPELIKGEIPEKVRVLGLEYEMIEKVHLDSINAGGKMVFSDLQIHFTTNLNPKVKYVILWHEVIHEIIDLCDEKHDNEQNICGIANVIGDMVFNNDMSWMGEK